MRLIDADKLLKSFGLSEKTRKFGGDHSGYDTRMLYEIQDTIEDAAEAEAIPIPWIKAQMEELESAGYMAEIGALGIKAMLIQWEKEHERNRHARNHNTGMFSDESLH